MPSRCLLHRSKLEPFKEYCLKRGYVLKDGVGHWQLVQVFHPDGQKVGDVYDNLISDEHYTVTRPLIPVVRKWLDRINGN